MHRPRRGPEAESHHRGGGGGDHGGGGGGGGAGGDVACSQEELRPLGTQAVEGPGGRGVHIVVEVVEAEVAAVTVAAYSREGEFILKASWRFIHNLHFLELAEEA